MASQIPRSITLTGELHNFSNLAPEVVEIILSFLPARSLVNALLVCRLWKDVGTRELIRRKRCRWVCRLFQCQDDKENPIDVKEAKRMVENQLFEFLDNVDTVPLAMVVATSSGLLANKKDIESFLTKTKEKLPVACPLVGCTAGGIIGETSIGRPEEVEGLCKGMSVLLIPKVKGVSVHLFNLSKKEISKNKRNQQSWRNSFGSLVEEDIKFVYLIGQSDTHESIGNVVMGVKKVFGTHVVVIGGMSLPFAILNDKVKYNGVIGLAVAGNVQANSVVHHGVTKQCLPNSFKRLTKDHPPERSVCFMVSCIGRGALYYNSKDVESSEFRNSFPGVKLFGFFGNGEVGTYMPANVQQTKRNSVDHHLHSYSTIFSILTLLDEEDKTRNDVA